MYIYHRDIEMYSRFEASLSVVVKTWSEWIKF